MYLVDTSVRSTLDCLIVQCAIEHRLVLLHVDREFAAMAPARRALRQLHFLS